MLLLRVSLAATCLWTSTWIPPSHPFLLSVIDRSKIRSMKSRVSYRSILLACSLVSVTAFLPLAPSSASPPSHGVSFSSSRSGRAGAARSRARASGIGSLERVDTCFVIGPDQGNHYSCLVVSNPRATVASRNRRGKIGFHTLMAQNDENDNGGNDRPSLNNSNESKGTDNGINKQDGNDTNSSKQAVAAANPLSTARVGGRSSSSIRRDRPKNDDDTSAIMNALKVGAPIIVSLTLLKSLFGGFLSPATSSNFVYYQSSTYESRIVGSDGRVQTTRRESMRSNIPSLMNGQDSYVDGGNGDSRSEIRRYLDISKADGDIDSEVWESLQEAREMIHGMGFSDFSSLDSY